MVPTSVFYRLGDTVQISGLLSVLSDRFSARRETVQNRTVYYDTFDWRLHTAGAQLSAESLHRGRLLRLLVREDPRGYRCPLETTLDFAWNLPAGPLRTRIASIIEMRRLLPIVELMSTGEQLAILDSRDKKVAMAKVARFCALRPGNPETVHHLPQLLITTPVRGYDEAFQELSEFLGKDLDLDASPIDLLTEALGAIGRRPGDYSPKLDLKLDPNMRTDAALKAIHKSLLKTMRQNEPGVRRDLDSEFLHDYRVALRRTRSALTQIKSVYAPDVVEPFKDDFAWLGRVTGPCRDLHVYQLKLPTYRAALPVEIRRNLEPLHIFLDRHLSTEQEKLNQALDSERYRRLIEKWVEFLDADLPQENAPANAELRVADVASVRIWKAYRRVLKSGRAIESDSAAEKLHRLRIDCKKLRYLLEFFRSLYPEGEVTPLVKSLKRLQDNLGDFNDLEIQQEQLTCYAEVMKTESLAPAPTLLAMGRLVGILAERQVQERQRFERRFEQFSRKTNRRRFRELFKPQKTTGS